MAVGAATSEQSSGETTSHFGSIRIRVDGIGQLRLAVFSLNDVKSKALVPLPMQDKARYSPTRLVNFVEQRASFEIKTINKGEKFRINRIVIFTKELYKSYPGS
jgi:hypothetical protein